MILFGKGIKAKDVHLFDNNQVKRIIDIRNASDFKYSNIKGSRNISAQKLVSNPNAYIKQAEDYYVICYSGMTSRRVCSELKKQGVTNVISVKGGFGAYERTRKS